MTFRGRAHNARRPSNLEIGLGGIDAGGGYTYLNQKTGFELSAVAGITYNWENTDTNYRNGVDSDLDWAVSQFLSENWEAGVVGYVYNRLSNDTTRPMARWARSGSEYLEDSSRTVPPWARTSGTSSRWASKRAT